MSELDLWSGHVAKNDPGTQLRLQSRPRSKARPAAASPRRHTFQLARIGKRRTPARRAVPGSTWRRRRIRRKRVFGRAQRFWIALRNRRQGIRCESEDVVHRVGCERRGRRGLGHQHRIRVSWRLSWRHQRPPHIPKHQLANLPERDANRGLHRATDHVVMDAGEVRTLLRRVQFRPQLGGRSSCTCAAPAAPGLCKLWDTTPEPRPFMATCTSTPSPG